MTLFAEEELPAVTKVQAKYEYKGEPDVQNSTYVPAVQEVPKMPTQEELITVIHHFIRYYRSDHTLVITWDDIFML